MKQFFLILFFTTSLWAENLLPSKQSENIKILIEKNVKEALLEIKGPYYIFNPKDQSRITSGLLGKRFLVHGTPKGVKWGEIFLDIHQISVVPRSENSTLFVNGIQYDGAISIYASGGKIHVVNELSIEDFIQATLSKEFLYPPESEVLSAVAILARTSAYFHAKNSRSFWHLDAKDIDYVGCYLNTPNSFIAKATKSTKDLILVHSVNGENVAFPATWTEHSAGKTATFSAIFRKESLCPSICRKTPHAFSDRQDSNWSYVIDKKELAKKFHMENIEKIELFLDHESNKSYALRLIGGDQKKDISFFSFQKILGKDTLLSNDFTIDAKEQEIVFEGYGKGHGVGLCLYSANLLAENGENAMEILTKFYPQTNLYNLTSKPTMLK